uniref:Uncharacterized protein n=1 Tax=Arundo donax TaxID=35708 RepID=A0A0A8ZLP5_ARUDO
MTAELQKRGNLSIRSNLTLVSQYFFTYV